MQAYKESDEESKDDCTEQTCFFSIPSKRKSGYSKTRSTFKLMPTASAKLLVFIKPFDEQVFESLFIFVKFIE